jgi:hypothetical protein
LVFGLVILRLGFLGKKWGVKVDFGNLRWREWSFVVLELALLVFVATFNMIYFFFLPLKPLSQWAHKFYHSLFLALYARLQLQYHWIVMLNYPSHVHSMVLERICK